MGWTWVELFAGGAACALRLVGGPTLMPPVAWMGGKRRLASAILGAMGVPEGRPERVVLADAGPWGWVWPLVMDPGSAGAVGAHLREWSQEHPRDLWERLAALPPAEDLHERAAQWLWLQARSASGVPIWWDGWRHVQADHDTGRTMAACQSGRGQPRPAGARAVGGRWEKGGADGGHQDAGRGQRGRWSFGARPDRTQEQRAAGMSGTTGSRTGGMVNPGTIANRVQAIAEAFRGVQVDVLHGDATQVGVIPGAWCYKDPPYRGATGYGWDLPRGQLVDLAGRWKVAGCVVGVSEAEPLAELAGWRSLDLTLGRKPEWLTLSHPPARVPERQLELWGEEE